MRGAHREKIEVTRMHALRHLQRDVHAGQRDSAHVVECAAHPHRRRAGARRVTFAMEPQQQCVAAEFEEAGAVFVRDFQDRLEAAADRIGDLLLAPSRPLRASCSDSCVNPEMSANAAVPSAVQHGVSGSARSMQLQDAGQVRNRTFGIGWGHCHDRIEIEACGQAHMLPVGAPKFTQWAARNPDGLRAPAMPP